MRSKLKSLLFILLLTTSAFCQVENLKWQRANLSYEKPSKQTQRDYSFEADHAGEFLKKSFVNAYWFFISDVDGNNCPFQPSCSYFFIEASHETNIFQASLIFSDRLTRDLNFSKQNHYPRVKNGHYYDPPQNYTLNQRRIIYLPPEFIVDGE